MFDDLGSMLAGPATQPPVDTNQQADLHSQWKGWLDNPANKAGLIAFGLQAMTGGWGNGASQLAAAIGSGLETAAGANKIASDEANAERARQDKLNDQGADRTSRENISANEIKSREKIANIMASTRMDVANLRNGGGAQNKEEERIAREAYNSVDKDFINNSQMSEDEKQILRESRAQAALDAHRRLFAGKNTSANLTNGNAPASPAVGKNSSAETSTNNANTDNGSDGKPRLATILRDARGKKALEDSIAQGHGNSVKGLLSADDASEIDNLIRKKNFKPRGSPSAQ